MEQTKVEVPQAIMNQAEEILAALPRGDWPTDDWYTIGDGWELNACKAEQMRCAILGKKDGTLGKIWRDIQ